MLRYIPQTISSKTLEDLSNFTFSKRFLHGKMNKKKKIGDIFTSFTKKKECVLTFHFKVYKLIENKFLQYIME